MIQNITLKMPQLLKWVGNKQRFAQEIISYMPSHINTYYEPFLGSGAVLGSLALQNLNELIPNTTVKEFVGSDELAPLIEIFNYVENDPDTLVNRYGYWRDQIDNGLDKKTVYNKALESFNKSQNGLDFAFVTRASFSGIVRFRKSDHYMSTPVGPHTPISTDNFRKRVAVWNKVLNGIQSSFEHANYLEMMRKAKTDDLVYCDPPYGNSQAILYGAQAFSFDELVQEIKACKDRGVKVMLSYNGLTKSRKVDTRPKLPEGLFESVAEIDVGISMVNRLQNKGNSMINESVSDLLLMTW